MATDCPQLKYLHIGSRHDYLQSRGFSDSVIETLVQRLPQLESLGLCVNGSSITEQALICIGQHCKALDSLKLPGLIDFTRYAKMGEPRPFPVLQKLHVAPDDYEALMFQVDSIEELHAIPDRIVLTMPRLRDFLPMNIRIQYPQIGSETGREEREEWNFGWAMRRFFRDGRDPFGDRSD